MYLVDDFLSDHEIDLKLSLLEGSDTLKREIKKPDIYRPGLALAGFLQGFSADRLLIFGNSEVLYCADLDKNILKQRLDPILTSETPALIIASSEKVPRGVFEACTKKGIPLLKTHFSSTEFQGKAHFLLASHLAPSTSCHGTFMEAFGLGVLIQGTSSIGKSEAALGLMDRGHRLISDDVVQLRLREDSLVEGYGPELNKHMMEIRGIGIINVAHLYGAVCVRESKSLDLIVKLEEWDDAAFYDRIGLDEKFIEMLGVNIPYHILPVKPGRDVVLLIETIVLNHRLKMMGYHSAREFNIKLLETIKQKATKRENIVGKKI